MNTTTKQPITAAIYRRVSSESQIDNSSLKEQAEQCALLCTMREWDVHAIYSDEGISGAKDETERPAMNDLLSALEAGKFSKVVILNEARFARDNNVAGYLNHKITQLGGELVSVEDAYDPSTMEGMIMQTFKRMYATMERVMIVQRTTAGRDARGKIDGEKGGRVPMGYRRVMVDGKSTGELTVDEDEAKIVRSVMYWRGERGLKLTAVAKDLNDRGYRTGRGGKFHPSTVATITRNSDKYRGGNRGESDNTFPVIALTWNERLAVNNFIDVVQMTPPEGYTDLGKLTQWVRDNAPMPLTDSAAGVVAMTYIRERP